LAKIDSVNDNGRPCPSRAQAHLGGDFFFGGDGDGDGDFLATVVVFFAADFCFWVQGLGYAV
jgi:hypothetical protein